MIRRLLGCLFFYLLAFIVVNVPCAYSQENVVCISTSYKSLLSTPDQDGMLDLIIKEAFHRVGMQAEIVFTPTERSLADVNAGLLDGEINRIAGIEQKYINLIRVPEPNMTMKFVAFSKRKLSIAGWGSIRDLHIGIVRGWKILEAQTQDFPHVTAVPTETELFTMLEKDRIDVALYAKLTGYEQLGLRGFTDIHHCDPPLESRDMFLYLHKKHANIVDSVAQAMRSMKNDGTYDLIVSKSVGQ